MITSRRTRRRVFLDPGGGGVQPNPAKLSCWLDEVGRWISEIVVLWPAATFNPAGSGRLRTSVEHRPLATSIANPETRGVCGRRRHTAAENPGKCRKLRAVYPPGVTTKTSGGIFAALLPTLSTRPPWMTTAAGGTNLFNPEASQPTAPPPPSSQAFFEALPTPEGRGGQTVTHPTHG